MSRRSPTRIKSNIQSALRLRPMELNELAIAIGSDYRATKKYLEELEQLGVVEKARGFRKGITYYQNVKNRKQLPTIGMAGIGDFVKSEVA